MTRAPTFDDIFAVMSAASVGDTAARVPLPNDLSSDDIATKMAIALNLLLDDLDFRSAEREQTVEALRESEERFRTVADFTYDWEYWVGADGQHLYVSPSCERLTGYRADEFIRDPELLHKIIHPDDRAILARHHQEQFQSEQEVAVDFRILTRSGELRWMSHACRPVYNADGRWLGRRASNRDITERKQAETRLREESHFLDSLVDSLPGAFYLFDAQGRFLRWNRNFERVTGYSAEEIAHMHPLDFFVGDDRRLITERIQEVFAQGQSTAEAEFVFKDGTHKPYFFTGSRVALPQGECLVGMGIDLTERKRAEQAVHESQQLLQAIIDNSTACVYVKDLEGRYILINRRWEQLFHITPEAARGKTDFDLFPHEQAEAFRAFDRQVLAAGTVLEAEELAPHDDGLHTYISIKCPLYNADGRPYAICGISTDITERKQAEIALAEERNLLRILIDHIPDYIYVKDTKSRFLINNQAHSRFFGFKNPEELQGKTDFEIQPVEFATRYYGDEQELVRSGQPLIDSEETAIDIQGRRRTVLSTKVPLQDHSGKIIGLVGVSRDITERKQAEQTLRTSEERYRLLFENNPLPMWVYDLETLRFLAVNDAAIQLYGYTQGEFLGMTILEIRPPEELARLRANLAEPSQQQERSGPWKHQKKDGALIDVEIISHEIEFMDRPARLVLASDITERLRAEDALRVSEERSRMLIEQASDGIFISDPQGDYVDANPRGCAMLGYSYEEIIQLSIRDVVDSQELTTTPLRLDELQEGKTILTERKLRRKDGSTFFAEISAKMLPNGNTQGIVRDVTERKQAEETLRQSEARFSTVFHSSPIGITMARLSDNRIIDANEAFLNMTGYERDELVDRTALELNSLLDMEKRESGLKRLKEGKTVSDMEFRIRKKNGEVGYFLISANVIEVGAEQFVLSTVNDITERKRAEEELREVREIFQKTFHQNAVATALSKLSNRIVVDVNAALEKLLGYSREELIDHPSTDFDYWVNPEERQRAYEIVLNEGKLRDYEFSFKTKSGTIGQAVLFIEVIEQRGEKYFLSTFIDVTERKRAEVALRESENHARSLLNLSKQLERAQTYSEALDAALNEVKAVIGYQNVWTYLLSEDKQQFRLLTITGEKSQVVAGDFPTLPIKEDRFLEEIAEGQDIVVVEDARTDPRTDKAIVAQLGNRTIVNVPIILMERHLGAFGTGSFGDEGVKVPTSTQLDFLRALASHMAVTLDRIHLLIQRKQAGETLRKSEARYRNMFESAAVSIWEEDFTEVQHTIDDLKARGVTDFRRYALEHPEFVSRGVSLVKVLDVNQQSLRSFAAASKDELLGSLDRLFLPETLSSFAKELITLAEGHQYFESEAAIQTLKGERRDVMVTIHFPKPSEQLDHTLVSLMDITERKQAEAEVRRLNAELEERVHLRTSQLEAANKELEAFSYSVSHDLRAPLRAIDGFSRILLEDYASSLEADGKRYLKIVRENTQQMGHLIDDLLTFSRIGRQLPQMERVEIASLVRQTLTSLEAEQKGRQVKITIGDLPPCQGDPALLKQVFLNLLSNALKYTRNRKIAHIEIGSRRLDQELVYFVRDDGAGFDMQYVDKLFGVFQRLHRAEDYEGTGVGLAIVQRIVHRHGGRIWAEAKVDQGATFYLTLPSVDGKIPKPAREKQTLASRAKDLI